MAIPRKLLQFHPFQRRFYYQLPSEIVHCPRILNHIVIMHVIGGDCTVTGISLSRGQNYFKRLICSSAIYTEMDMASHLI